MVNNKLTGDEVRGNQDLYESLLNLKESLLGRKYKKESFEVDILKVLELKQDLIGE